MGNRTIVSVVGTAIALVAGTVGGVITYQFTSKPNHVVPVAPPGPSEPKKLPDDLIEFVQVLRKACTEGELKGAWIEEPAEVSGKRLLLPVHLDNEGAQLKLITNKIEELLKDDRFRSVKDKFPDGVATGELEVFAVRTKGMALQQQWGNIDSREKSEERQVLRQTRLDDLYYTTAGELLAKGVCIANADESVIDRTVEAEVEKLIRDVITREEKRPRKIVVKIERVTNPSQDIDLLVNKDEQLRGLTANNAFYNNAGKLELSAVIRQNDHVQVVRDQLRVSCVGNWLTTKAVRSGDDWSVDPKNFVVLDVSALLQQMQSRLAEEKSIGSYVRVDDAVLTPKPLFGLVLHVEGLCIYPDPDEKDEVTSIRIADALGKRIWPERPEGFPLPVEVKFKFKKDLARSLLKEANEVPDRKPIQEIEVFFDGKGNFAKPFVLPENFERTVEKLLEERQRHDKDLQRSGKAQKEVHAIDDEKDACEPTEKPQNDDPFQDILKQLRESQATKPELSFLRLDDFKRVGPYSWQSTGVWLHDGKGLPPNVKTIIDDWFSKKAFECWEQLLRKKAVGEAVITKYRGGKYEVKIRDVENPKLTLQRLAARIEKLDGVQFKPALFDKNGRLTLEVLGCKPQESDLKQFLKDNKAVFEPLLLKEETSEDSLVWRPYDGGPKDNLWTGMLKSLQASFSENKKEVLFLQTRLDRAFYLYDGADSTLQLHFRGSASTKASQMPGDLC